MITSARPKLTDVLCRLLGDPRCHPRRKGLWWRCCFCNGDLCLTADVFEQTWQCRNCKGAGGLGDFLREYDRIDHERVAELDNQFFLSR